MTFDIARRVSLRITGTDADTEQFMIRQMDPCAPGEAPRRAATVLIEYAATPAEIDELVNPANDGRTTAATGPRHCIVVSGRACVLPEPGSATARFVLDEGFPLQRIVRLAIRPALQLACLESDAVAIHGACVAIDGSAVAVAGWSETGKTETALALLEMGATFVSDKWTVVGADATASTFPISVGVRRWALASLPTLREALPATVRVQMGCAGVVDAVTRPARSLGGRRVGQVLARGIALADRAALTPSQIAAAYGHAIDPGDSPPLGLLVLLATSAGGAITVDDVDADWAARRLARSAAYERRAYFDLFDRARFLTGADEPVPYRLAVERREEAFLARALDGVRVLRVRAPFPADPKRVADAVMEHRRR